MRILSWIELFWPYVGGIEVKTANMMAELQARGHETAVITGHGSLSLPDEDEYKGSRIYRFPFLEALSSQRLDLFVRTRRGVEAAKKQFQPDVVHIQFTDPSPLFHWQTQRPPVPTVVTIPIALPDAPGSEETLVGRTLTSASWVVTCSRAMMDHTLRQAPSIAGKSSVIFNSLPFPEFAPPRHPGPPVLLAIGRVVRDKGFDVAVDAMPRVLAAFPEARLIIAGDGPEKPALERQCEHLGIADRVQFPGWVAPERIGGLLQQASVVLMPSRWEEAFGLVALQAMQMARPVVATKVGGLPEVVSDGVSGLVVSNENPSALADAAIQLLADPERAARMGEAGREIARAKFSFDRFVSEHESLYSKLVENARD